MVDRNYLLLVALIWYLTFTDLIMSHSNSFNGYYWKKKDKSDILPFKSNSFFHISYIISSLLNMMYHVYPSGHVSVLRVLQSGLNVSLFDNNNRMFTSREEVATSRNKEFWSCSEVLVFILCYSVLTWCKQLLHHVIVVSSNKAVMVFHKTEWFQCFDRYKMDELVSSRQYSSWYPSFIDI